MKVLSYLNIPKFICYHNKVFPFGIIQANSSENINKWLCTKCINTVYNPNSPLNKFDLAICDVWGNGKGITTQQVFNIKKNLIPLINIDLLSMFRTFIDNECYVHGYITYEIKRDPYKFESNAMRIFEKYRMSFLVK